MLAAVSERLTLSRFLENVRVAVELPRFRLPGTPSRPSVSCASQAPDDACVYRAAARGARRAKILIGSSANSSRTVATSFSRSRSMIGCR